LYEYFVFTTLSYWFVWQAKRFLLAELMFFAGVLMSLLLRLSHKMFDESPVVVNAVENKVKKTRGKAMIFKAMRRGFTEVKLYK